MKEKGNQQRFTEGAVYTNSAKHNGSELLINLFCFISLCNYYGRCRAEVRYVEQCTWCEMRMRNRRDTFAWVNYPINRQHKKRDSLANNAGEKGVIWSIHVNDFLSNVNAMNSQRAFNELFFSLSLSLSYDKSNFHYRETSFIPHEKFRRCCLTGLSKLVYFRSSPSRIQLVEFSKALLPNVLLIANNTYFFPPIAQKVTGEGRKINHRGISFHHPSRQAFFLHLNSAISNLYSTPQGTWQPPRQRTPFHTGMIAKGIHYPPPTTEPLNWKLFLPEGLEF